MALTIPLAWTKAMRAANASPLYWVDIQVADGVNYLFFSGQPAFTPAQSSISIASLSTISQELNPLTRESSLGAIEIVLQQDAYVKKMMLDYRIRGKRVVIKLGEASLGDPNDFLTVFTGYISEAVPSYSERTISIEVENTTLKLRDTKISRTMRAGQHPLKLINDFMILSGILSGDIDATTLDPTTDTAISHFNVYRGPSLDADYDTTINEESSAELVSQLSQICYGGILPREDGQVVFKRFNASNTIVDTLTDADIISVEHVSNHDYTINRVKVSIAPSTVNRNYFTGSTGRGVRRISTADVAVSAPLGGFFENVDETAATALGGGDGSKYYADLQVNNPWLSAFALCAPNATPPDYTGTGNAYRRITTSMTALDFFSGSVHSFCGMRASWPAASQPASAKLSAGRLGWFKLQTGEVISSQAITPAATVQAVVPDNDATLNASGKALATVVRSRLGTTAINAEPEHTVNPSYADGTAFSGPGAYGLILQRWEVPVYDVTIAKYISDAIITRFAYGVEVIKVRVHAWKYGPQLGDFVGLETGEFLSFARDGTASFSDKWEVIAKDDDLLSDSPSVTYTLAMAARGVPPTPSYGYAFPNKFIMGIIRAGISNINSQVIANQGFNTNITGLVVTFDPGTIVLPTTFLEITSKEITLPATKVMTIAVDLLTRSIVSFIKAASDDYDLSFGLVKLYDIETDGSGVVGEIDFRQSQPITGAVVRDATLGPAQSINTQNAGLIPNSEFQIWSGIRTVATSPPDNWITVDVTASVLGEPWNTADTTDVGPNTTDTEVGGYGITMVTGGATEPGLAIGQHIPVYPGAVYSWEASILNNNVFNNYHVKFYYTQGGSNPFSANLAYSLLETVNGSGTGSFVRKTGRFVAAPPAGFGFISAMIAVGAASPAAIVVDYFKVKREGTLINARRASTDQVVASGSDVIVQLNSEGYDYGAEFNTSTHKAVITEPGVYDISGTAVVGHLSGTEFARTSIFVNGSVARRGTYATAGGTNRNVTVMTVLTGAVLSAGDEVQMAVDHNGAGTVYARLGAASTYLYIRKVDI